MKQGLCAKSLQSCLTLCDPIDCSPLGSSVHGDLPGKNTGVGCHALLQGIFPMHGSNLHSNRRVLYHYRHLGSPGTQHSHHWCLEMKLDEEQLQWCQSWRILTEKEWLTGCSELISLKAMLRRPYGIRVLLVSTSLPLQRIHPLS